MKTVIIALASLTLLSTAAFAGETTKTINVGVPSGDSIVRTHGCFPATGNWKNAATQSCPDRGSGGVGFSQIKTVTVPDCEASETKGKRS